MLCRNVNYVRTWRLSVRLQQIGIFLSNELHYEQKNLWVFTDTIDEVVSFAWTRFQFSL